MISQALLRRVRRDIAVLPYRAIEHDLIWHPDYDAIVMVKQRFDFPEIAAMLVSPWLTTDDVDILTSQHVLTYIYPFWMPDKRKLTAPRWSIQPNAEVVALYAPPSIIGQLTRSLHN
jgi:hypothetical protein